MEELEEEVVVEVVVGCQGRGDAEESWDCRGEVLYMVVTAR